MKTMLMLCLCIVSVSVFASAGKNVLLVFPQLENLSLTGRMVMGGAELSKTQFGSLSDDVNFIRLEPDRNLKTMGEEVSAAIDKYKPVAIIGAITSNAAFVIGDIAQARRIPFITPFATHPGVTKGKSFVFRACFDDDYQAKRLAEFVVTDLKKKKIAILVNSSNAYSIGINAIFQREALSLGASIVVLTEFSSEKDIDSEKLNRIKKANPDAVLLPSYQVEAAAILSRLINVLPKKTTYVGPDSWGGGRLFHKVFQERDPNFIGFYVQHISEDGKSEAVKQFDKSIKRSSLAQDPLFQNYRSMTAPAAIGFDAGRILFEAFRIQKMKKIELRDAIEKVRFIGFTGRISFEAGNTPEKSLFMYSIDKSGERFFKEFK